MTPIKKSAFSLIELSIVILIIGILVAGVTQGSRLIKAFKLSNARALTSSSPVHSIKDLVFWLDATSESTLLNQDGSTNIDNEETISSWTDSNLRNTGSTPCLQATLADQPQYIDDAINGIPAIVFNSEVAAVDMRLSCNLPSGTRVTTTIFIVTKWTKPSSASITPHFIFIGSSSSAQQTVAMVRLTTLFIFANKIDASTTLHDNLGFVSSNDENTLIITRSSNNPNSSLTVPDAILYSNGEPIDSGASSALSGFFTDTELTIGNSPDGGVNSDLNIGEIIIFDRVLKTEERESIEEYLSQKWGIKLEG
jgi:prepilin-type N-terminal cleavage/methylation domain-containing protein